MVQQQGQHIELISDGMTITVMSVDSIPTTLGGAAQHNVANAMGVIGLMLALGIKLPAIREGLAHFKGDVADNPGRGNYFDVNGGKLLVDFAHNPHSLTAIINTVKAMPAKRRFNISCLEKCLISDAIVLFTPDLFLAGSVNFK